MRIPTVVRELLPPLAARLAERPIQSRIDTLLETQDLETDGQVSIDTYRRFYDAEEARHGRLDDKAKTNLLGLTLAVSVIFAGLGSVRREIGAGSSWILLSLLVAGVAYLLLGGFSALRVLRVTKFFRPTPTNADNPESVWQCTQLNQLVGVQKANYTYDSYVGMRNGVLCLAAFVTVLMFVPVANGPTDGEPMNERPGVVNNCSVSTPITVEEKQHAIGYNRRNVIVFSRLHIRSGPSVTAAHRAWLSGCDVVRVVDERDGWALVVVEEGDAVGIQGWVLAEYLAPK